MEGRWLRSLIVVGLSAYLAALGYRAFNNDWDPTHIGHYIGISGLIVAMVIEGMPHSPSLAVAAFANFVLYAAILSLGLLVWKKLRKRREPA
jgi:hypothetical protein